MLLPAVQHCAEQLLPGAVDNSIRSHRYTSFSTYKPFHNCNHVQDTFHEKRLKIKGLLQKSYSVIHLSFDLWTSPNNLAFAAIVAHFRSSATKKIESIVIGFREIRGAHTGENIAYAVQRVLQDYDLDVHKLGCFVLDNAPNNDTAIAALGRGMDWTKKQCKERRLRCLGHIINLCA